MSFLSLGEGGRGPHTHLPSSSPPLAECGEEACSGQRRAGRFSLLKSACSQTSPGERDSGKSHHIVSLPADGLTRPPGLRPPACHHCPTHSPSGLLATAVTWATVGWGPGVLRAGGAVLCLGPQFPQLQEGGIGVCLGRLETCCCSCFNIPPPPPAPIHWGALGTLGSGAWVDRPPRAPPPGLATSAHMSRE